MTSKPADDRRSGGAGGVARARRSSAPIGSRVPPRQRARRSIAPCPRGSRSRRACRRRRHVVGHRHGALRGELLEPPEPVARAAAVDRLAGGLDTRGRPRRRGRRCSSASPHCSTSAARCGPRSRPSNTARSAAQFAAASPPLRSSDVQGRSPNSPGSTSGGEPRPASRRRRGTGRWASPRPNRPRRARPRRARSASRPGCRPSAARWPHRRRRSAESAAPPDWSAARAN